MCLEVNSLNFFYESRDLQIIAEPLLDNITFRVDSVLHIRGGNGSGKTTLLRIISGILSPFSGDIKYQGKSILHNSYDYKNVLSYVGHKLGINLQLTVFENCYYYLKNIRSKSEILKLLELFGLGNMQDVLSGYLSAGQKKRLSLLKVMLTDSKIWILDEPFTALDVNFVELFVKFMREHVLHGGIIIYTSHQSVAFDGVTSAEYNL